MGDEGTPKTEMINPALLDGVSANFIVKGPTGVEKAFPMRQITMTIGRSDQCDIAVKDSSMSGRHAEIVKINGEIRLKDLGSANGVWLNGERVDDVELFDGDVLRMGQTSIRIDVVGGRKRPDAGMSPKVLAGIIGGVVLLAVIGIVVGLKLKQRAQHKRDLATVSALVDGARKSQASTPCTSAVSNVGEIAGKLNALGKPSCANPPKGEEAKKLVGGYRELAKVYDRTALQVQQYTTTDSASATALSSAAEQIADANIKAKIGELQELIDARNAVGTTFIGDWKKLGQATNAYAAQAEQAFVGGNKAACAVVDKGVQGKSVQDVVTQCTKNFVKAKNAVEDKLKELDDLAAGGTGEAASE